MSDRTAFYYIITSSTTVDYYLLPAYHYMFDMSTNISFTTVNYLILYILID